MLKDDLARQLRDEINAENTYFSKLKNTKEANNVWNQISAMMDRIEQTIWHINLLDLHLRDHTQLAYGFIDVLNHVNNLTEYINIIHLYFPTEKYEVFIKSYEVFNQPGKSGKGSDLKYLKYLRSLSAPHALNTSNYKSLYQDSQEYCPFILWESRLHGNGVKTDIVFHVYKDDGESSKDIYLNSRKIYEFAERMIKSLTFVFDEIHIKAEEYFSSLSKLPLKNVREFSSKSEYINYVNTEYTNRLTNDYEEIFDYYTKLFEYDFSHLQSHPLIDRYKQGVWDSIISFSEFLQTLQETKNTMRFTDLYVPYPKGKKLIKYGYHLQKINQLVEDIYFDSTHAKHLIYEMREFYDQFLNIDEAISNFELFTLVSTALYLYMCELENES